jgi:hypothetical protein
MRIRSCVLAAGCGLAMVALGGASAFAGEVNGKQQYIDAPSHANSICVYSGQNALIENDAPGRVQSYGQLVRIGLKGTPDVPSPGIACNGHLNPLKGDGGGGL